MSAPPRNRFAAKPEDQQHSETLYVRLKKRDKRRIIEAAGDRGVAAWAREVLLSAAASKPVKAANKTGAANRSQAIRSETNRTSSASAHEGLRRDESAAGFRR
jgi:hypothetical protein